MNSWYIDRSNNCYEEGIRESLVVVDAAGDDTTKLSTDLLVEEFNKTGGTGNVIDCPAAFTGFRDHGILRMNNTMGDTSRLYYDNKLSYGELIIDLFVKRFTRKGEYTPTRPFVIMCMVFSHMIQMGIDEDDIFITAYECHKYLLDIDDYTDLSFELVEKIISERTYEYSTKGRAIKPCVELSPNGSANYRLYFNALKLTPLFIPDTTNAHILRPNIKQKDFFRYVSENATEFAPYTIKTNTDLYNYYCDRRYGFAEIIPAVIKKEVVVTDSDIPLLFDYLFGYDNHSGFDASKYLTKECFGAYFAFISVPGLAIAKIRDDNSTVAEQLLNYSKNTITIYQEKLESMDFVVENKEGEIIVATNTYTNEAAFKSWMQSQFKPNGEPRLTTNTINAYLSALKAVASKFGVAPILNIQTVEELDITDQVIRNAPEFEAFNKNRGNGALSAGLIAYREFLVAPKNIVADDIEIAEDNSIEYAWFVGYRFDERDHDEFIEQGVWYHNGDSMDAVNEIEVGDRIAIKSTGRRIYNVPFENYGQEASFLRFKAIGVVLENKKDGRNLVVNWKKLIPVREWYFTTGAFRGTISKCTDKEILDFVFKGEVQDYEKYLSMEPWESRYQPQPDIVEEDVADEMPSGENEDAETENYEYVDAGFTPEQVIYYGAPGTGKSFEVDEKLKKAYKDKDEREYHSVRAIFHPDYTYGDFVGSIRPIKPDGKSLTYDFVAGPFTELLKKSFLNPNEEFYLVLEEINRGNAAAIFGDLFQLLDRDDKTGLSSYRIDNADIAGALKKDKRLRGIFAKDKIWLPSNFNIICTMNTADQNVFVLDSAFKRRFAEEYTEIDFSKLTDGLKNTITVFEGTTDLKSLFANTTLSNFVNQLDEQGKLNRDWATFAQIVNYIIDDINEESGSEQISEDKKLGPFFVTAKDLESRKNFVNKVLHYLKQDVFKYIDFYFAESYQTIYSKYQEDSADVFTLLKRQGE